MNGRLTAGRPPRAGDSEFRHGLRASAGVIVAVALTVLAISLGIAFLHFEGHVSVYRLISDPAPFVGMPWYFGTLSNANVLIWTASAAICTLAAKLLWDSVDMGQRRLGRMLAILGAGSLWFAIDDLLLVHEQIGRLLFDAESRHTGEALVFFAYALLMLGCFLWYRETVAKTELALLVAALITLGVSVSIDTVLQLDMGGNNYVLEIVLSRSWGGPTIDIVEDMLKLGGGMLMFAYFFRTGYAALRKEIKTGAAVPLEAIEIVSPVSNPRRRLKVARR